MANETNTNADGVNLDALKDLRLAYVEAGKLGSFVLYCENVDDTLCEARELLMLWRLKDRTLEAVHVMIYRPCREHGLCAEYIVFEDRAELYVEG
ncbi:hypothetical protein [Paratractidigestivibacter sp.]|uniref:hypothetical protein n=1 Tax=Paratractidigestivibacter sp. TaxID=2847316 RepID=UPI002ACB1068|nr:hypothetical protein [Paratractidigestivibacter sp.]